MIAIINAELVMRDHLIPEAVLFIEDGKIASYGEMRTTPIPEDCQIIDAEGLYVAPGLIDIHSHTGENCQVWEDPVTCARFLLEHGVTTLLPAFRGRMSVEERLFASKQIRSVMTTPEGENIGGVYMEGPYLNPGFGANRANNPWAKPAVEEEYLPFVEAGADLARVWCIAPERPEILQFVKTVRKYNSNIRFAVAHSEATPEQIEELMPYGLSIATHHTNATGTIVKYPECRGVCVDEAVNYNDDIYAELICDSRGIHVDPYMLRLVRKIKGDDRIILISDRTCYNGPIPPGYEGVTDLNFDDVGEIAGSKLTLDVACQNFMKHTGASVVDVFKVASYNPARATGFTDRGEIRVGLRADLVFVDHKMNVHKVILGGSLKFTRN